MEEVIMKIGVAENFNLEKAVCNHGFFMMAPNKWIPSHKSFTRPLSLPDNHDNKSSVVVEISITQPSNRNFILLKHPPQLSSHHRQSIRVARMLHISPADDKMVHDFHKLHPRAKESGFPLIFRSPTLFEDIVKSILLCNCNWARSLEMAEALCNLECKLSEGRGGRKRKHCSSSNAFPTPNVIACLDEVTLNKHCKLGYRASIIADLSRNVLSGSLSLDECDHQFLRPRLSKIRGIGPFTIANVMMCIGIYQHIPVDTETLKHLQQVHGKTKSECTRKSQRDIMIRQIYDQYAPFQCLVYWMERVEYYEKSVGRLSELPRSEYRNVASTNAS